jgi:hypothetical protein
MADAAPELVPFRWNAERLARHRLMEALHQGAAAAIYAGHGNARGYFAYGGITADELTEGPAPGADESLGVLFSLSCRTGHPAALGPGATRPSRGLADAVVGAGVAGAVLAPNGDPLHEDNRALSVALIRTLASGARSCADIVHTLRADGAPLDGYAIIGDRPCESPPPRARWRAARESSRPHPIRSRAAFGRRPNRRLSTTPLTRHRGLVHDRPDGKCDPGNQSGPREVCPGGWHTVARSP